MKQETSQLLTRLGAFDWFKAVGKSDVPGGDFVKSWKEAVRACSTQDYDDNLLEMANELRSLVGNVSEARLSQWNEHCREIKPLMEQVCAAHLQPVVAANKLSSSFVNTVRWHIMHAAYEQEYADLVPPGIFSKHMDIYFQGHFPCGWEGEYPQGRMIVF